MQLRNLTQSDPICKQAKLSVCESCDSETAKGEESDLTMRVTEHKPSRESDKTKAEQSHRMDFCHCALADDPEEAEDKVDTKVGRSIVFVGLNIKEDMLMFSPVCVECCAPG